jgi:hypothetical protein
MFTHTSDRDPDHVKQRVAFRTYHGRIGFNKVKNMNSIIYKVRIPEGFENWYGFKEFENKPVKFGENVIGMVSKVDMNSKMISMVAVGSTELHHAALYSLVMGIYEIAPSTINKIDRETKKIIYCAPEYLMVIHKGCYRKPEDEYFNGN